MIPKLTKKEFVGIWNVSRRMTDQERALLWQAIYAAGINPPHKKSYGKILTHHEWNTIVRPALRWEDEPKPVRVIIEEIK